MQRYKFIFNYQIPFSNLTLFIIIGCKIAKWIWQFEAHLDSRSGVGEADGLRLQAEVSVRLFFPAVVMAVELIAQDGASQSLLVGTVHSQLVCTPRVWPECQEGIVIGGW